MRFIASLVFLIILQFDISPAFTYDELSMSQCTMYKNALASLAANVTRCFITFSQPLRICEFCNTEFVALKKMYNELSNKTDFMNYCRSQLIESDILSVMSDIYNKLVEEWTTANCGQCYKDRDSFTEKSSDFVKFLQLVDLVVVCFENYTNANLAYRDPKFEADWKGRSFNDTACTPCTQSYKAANKFYLEVQEKMPQNQTDRLWKGLCGDMGEIMNMTRFLWSKKFNCTIDSIQWYWAIGPICTVLAMLMVFYCMVSTYFHNKIDMIMYKQRRLRPIVYESSSKLLETMN